MACLCEFVEANRTEICSGWRPLFGTLRVANSKHNANAILEVFRIFLSTDNTLVFANAALDYILCLLSHIRNTIVEETIQDAPIASVILNKSTNVTDNFIKTPEKTNGFLDREIESTRILNGPVDLCLESLKLLQNCASILSMMYNMPKCPTFNLTHRINIDTEPQLVDPIVQNSSVVYFDQEEYDQISYKILSMKIDMENCEKENMTLTKMDKQSGVLRIWYILLEGLCSATVISAQKNQPYIVEALFSLLKDLIADPGINFGLYCINHLLLPMVQNWLRQNNKIQKCFTIWLNFKHCVGMTSEILVDYIQQLQGNQTKGEMPNIENPGATLALKQLMLILIECVTQPNENIARLGTSCIRHIILSVGQILTVHQWEILVTGMHRACSLSLNPLQQITLAFKPQSDSFYGDLATVKVAARKDSTVDDNKRLNDLAQQVFLMQSQKNCTKCVGKICDCDQNNNIVVDERSYVFLLYPLDITSVLNPDLYTVRVPFRNMVVGILAHQMLIQTISSALLQNLNHVTPILNILQINTCSLRGILTHVNAKHVDILLKCLEISDSRAREFDLRPGLKFLTQKVGNLNKAANLYTQANTSEIVQIIVLIELCLDGIEKYSISPKDLKELLRRDERDKCLTDIDYVEDFLRKLQSKWEHLCESYMKLTVTIPENDCFTDSNETLNDVNQSKYFKYGELKRSESFTSSTDSESYLEKEVLPSMNKSETLKAISPNVADESNVKKSNMDLSNSTDDETNELAAKYNKVLLKMDSNTIKYDTNTLLQMKVSQSVDDIENVMKSHTKKLDKEMEEKVEAMLEQYRKRKPGQYSTPQTRQNPFTNHNIIPPPQPVPPEIQQQRSISIFKDSECYKNVRIETMEACLELLCSLPSDRLTPIAMVLKEGAVLLIGANDEKIKLAAENLLQRMNISYVDHDNFDI